MNLRATQAQAEPEPRNGPMKFTYTSGSRPLEGYTIKRGIGRGGFGEVYYATSDAGKEVALKLIRRNLDIELRGVTQCLNVKHPNLLGLFDVKQDELGDSWVVMEYVAGECLEDAIARHPQGLSREDALAWFRGVAAGVAYLHDHGIVHRDLKPGNIFSDEGLVKIGDYGLSKFISASRRSGQTESVGTVHYMAPEIGNGRYGKEIDIYALGIILFEMLTGRVPFEGESVGEVLMKHLTAEPNLADVEEPYRGAIARCLAKDPEARLKTVGELVSLLPEAARVGVSAGVGGCPSGFAQALPGVGKGSGTPAGAAPAASEPRLVMAEVVPAVEVDEEPIWRAVRDRWREFSQAWTSGRITSRGKAAIILVSLAVLSPSYGLIVLSVPVLFFAYLVYYAVRSIVLANRRPQSVPVHRTPVPTPKVSPAAVPPRSGPQASQPPPTAMRQRRRRSLAQTAMHLPAKTGRERFMELTGSLLFAVPVAAVMCVVMGILRGQAPRPEQFAWLALVSTIGSWLVLTTAKFWEGKSGEPNVRRFVLMLLGLGLGVVAWGGKEWLLVGLPYEWIDPVGQHALGEQMFGNGFTDRAHGVPTLMGHMAYFAFLLMVLRWWHQADPLRPSRLSLWPVVVTAGWAWVLQFFWSYPQPWGVMIAAT
ncbi:MAG TPA: serine/threonine-protein kinase, partial [Pirellulales bacterium]|nr:serine/threonine-protein kinase [Pirellulales bacterium]